MKQQAESLLARVGLTAAAATRTGRFSGGMRRRLSVAIALLGACLAFVTNHCLAWRSTLYKATLLWCSPLHHVFGVGCTL